MVRRTWLLSDEERAIAKLKGWSAGWNAGWNEGRNEGRNEGERNVLTQLIGLRFPTTTTEFIEKTLNYLKNPSDVKETVSAAMSTNSFEEFQRRVLMLAPGR